MSITVDRISKWGIEGWAINSINFKNVTVTFEIDGNPLRSVNSNRYRKDLQKVREDGQLAFQIRIGHELRDKICVTSDCVLVSSIGERHNIDLNGTNNAPFNPLNVHGERLALNKDGYLVVPFANMSDFNKARLLDYMTLLGGILEHKGYPSFLAYGSLLGSIRGKSLIPHDDDIDLAVFVGRDLDIEMIEDESINLCKILVASGYSYHRFSVGQIQAISEDLHIDLFLSWSSGTRYFLNYAINGEIELSSVFPLSKGELEGREFFVPNQYNAFLEHLYGENWRTPISDFSWERAGKNPEVDKDLLENSLAWNREHGKVSDKLYIPSQFAVFALERTLVELNQEIDLIIDLGCGRGADMSLFSHHCHYLVGVDFSTTALEMLSDGDNIFSLNYNLEDKLALAQLIIYLSDLISKYHLRSCLIYSRQLFEYLSERSIKNLMASISGLSALFLSSIVFVEIGNEQSELCDINACSFTPNDSSCMTFDELIELARSLGFDITLEATSVSFSSGINPNRNVAWMEARMSQ